MPITVKSQRQSESLLENNNFSDNYFSFIVYL